MLYNGPWMAERDVAVGDFIRRKPEFCRRSDTPCHHRVRLEFSAADAFKAFYKSRSCALLRTRLGQKSMRCLSRPLRQSTVSTKCLKIPPPRMGGQSLHSDFVNLLDLCAIAVPSAFTTNGLPSRRDIDCSRHFAIRSVIVAGQTYMAAAEHRGARCGWVSDLCFLASAFSRQTRSLRGAKLIGFPDRKSVSPCKIQANAERPPSAYRPASQ